MTYNYKSIESFLEKVNKEAEQSAQAVFDKYEAEFLERVQAQLKEGDTVYHAMGVCTIENLATGEEHGKNLSKLLGQYQYYKITNVGMTLPYKFTKSEILK